MKLTEQNLVKGGGGEPSDFNKLVSFCEFQRTFQLTPKAFIVEQPQQKLHMNHIFQERTSRRTSR